MLSNGPSVGTVSKSSNSSNLSGDKLRLVEEISLVVSFFARDFSDGLNEASNRFFKIRSSFNARSSNPNKINFPTNADIPFSICIGGNSIVGVFEDCSIRRYANAKREHSATALGPEAFEGVDVEDEDGERIRRFPTFGELVTLFNDRGWSGD